MLEQFKQVLIKQEKLLISANMIDKTHNGDELDFDSLCSIIDNVNLQQKLIGLKLEEKQIDSKFIAERRLTPVGQIGILCEDNNVYAIINAILYGVICNNNLIVNLYNGKNLGVLNLLIQELNKVLQANNKESFVKTTNENYDKFVGKVSTLDKIIIIGERNFFNSLTKDILVNYKYYPFGKSNLILFTKNFNTELKPYILNNNVYSNIKYVNAKITDVSDVKEAIDLISCSQTNYQTCLFTENEKDGKYFLNNCKSDFVLLNTLPNINNLPNVRQIDFLAEKILIYPNK